ncbi:MAG TPA: DNA polymerase III subunit delta [Stellaceae bacterium]|nr:DNA polymerase III subunit delta [Stellaceae bacterium]
MKLPPARLVSFLRSPGSDHRAVLIYGADAGLVRERADTLARAVSPELNDPFRVSELSAAAILADRARLHDEAASQSLTGGRRLVRVREAGDAASAVLERYLADPPKGEALVLVEAGELAKKSSLRRLFENHALGVAIACYADGDRERQALVREVMGAHAITITPDAVDYLAGELGEHRGVSRQELEKLALYAGDEGRVTVSEARALIGDGTGVTPEDIVFAAAEGEVRDLVHAMSRAFHEGQAAVALVRAALRHFQRLHLAASHLAAGASPEEAIRALRPPVFALLQERFKQQLRHWPPRRLVQALDLLLEAERNTKRTGIPDEAVAQEVLLRLARAVAQRRP